VVEDVGTSGAPEDAVWTIGSAGDYTVRVFQREDGAAIDKLVFQQTNLSAPSGMGPPESQIVPEPSTLALFVLGITTVGLMTWRRKRS